MIYDGRRVHLKRLSWPRDSCIIPPNEILFGYREEDKLTCVVFPSNFAKTLARVTWGMIFFSTTSWNIGGGGRSTARSKKGVSVVLVSRAISKVGFARSVPS